MLKTEEKTGEKEFTLPQVEAGIKEMYLSGIHLGYSQTSRNPKDETVYFRIKKRSGDF